MSKMYGYARVSTAQQHEDRQLLALREQGVAVRDIYIDKQSGKDFARPAYQRLCRNLHAGDTLFVPSIDRLGRNYREIQAEWQALTQKRGVEIVVIDMPLLDTRRDKNLLGTFISDIVLSLLSFIADNERREIRERQRQGIAAARQRGVRFGRPPQNLPKEFSTVCRLWSEGKLTSRDAARRLHMPESTFRYRAKHSKQK